MSVYNIYKGKESEIKVRRLTQGVVESIPKWISKRKIIYGDQHDINFQGKRSNNGDNTELFSRPV